MDSSKDIAKRIPQLDGIRGLAVILVIINHYLIEVPHGFRFFSVGFIGVNLFFVLSGFLIGGILIKNREAWSFFIPFYARRFFRIIPIYYLVVFCFFIVIKTSPLPPLTYFCFAQNVFMSYAGIMDCQELLPTWTLAVEEQFYLILPLLVWFLSPKTLLKSVVVLILLSPLARLSLFMLASSNNPAPYILLPCRSDLLFFGVLAAICLNDQSLRTRIFHKNARIIKIGMLTGAFTTSIIMIAGHWTGLMIRDSLYLTPLGLCFACYFLLITRDNASEGKMFNAKYLRFFGNISYCLYLIHQPISGLLHGYILKTNPDIQGNKALAVTILAVACSVGLSWLSWKYFESPLMRFGHRWEYKSANEVTMQLRGVTAHTDPLSGQ